MSLITRCPACGTMFKVVADQLKISEGWVRCGHCAEIFDAGASLQDEAELEPAQPAVQDTPPQATEQRSAEQVDEAPILPQPSPGFDVAPAPTPAASAAAAAEHDDEFPSSIHSHVDDSELDVFASSRQLDEEAQALRADPRDRPFELRRADPLGLRDEAREPTWSESAADPELHDLSFVRQARRKAFWRRPFVRVVLLLTGLVLVALLALQIALQDRDRLAVTDPTLRPWLEKLCEVARCTLGSPRRIESIAIDSSSFNKLRGDTYRLNVTLKNQASTEVAMPALELTLTDSQDQAVLRRVLPPAEFAGRTTVLLPGAEWSTSLALAVTGSSASRIAGYRVLAFYP